MRILDPAIEAERMEILLHADELEEAGDSRHELIRKFIKAKHMLPSVEGLTGKRSKVSVTARGTFFEVAFPSNWGSNLFAAKWVSFARYPAWADDKVLKFGR